VRRFLLVLSCVLTSLSAGCSRSTPSIDDFGPLPDFHFTERNGDAIGRQDLEGKTWVAAFIFTRCAGPCTQISGSMAQLQSRLSDLPNVRLVSFSVDPEYDTPAVLSAYAQKFGAKPDRWLFLTGETKPMYELLRQGFKVGVEAASPEERKPGNEVMHSTRLVVVDRNGHHRGFFDGLEQQSLDRLVEDVRALDREKP
jgi:protein SCO1